MEPTTQIKTDWTTLQEVELVYKSTIKASQRPVVITYKNAYSILINCWNENKIELQEEFKVLLMNRSNKVMALYEVSTGGIAGTVADIRLILVAALKTLATGIILAHNHPSGNTKPSATDEQLTQKIKQAAALHDIKLLDHIILSAESYYSFADEGSL